MRLRLQFGPYNVIFSSYFLCLSYLLPLLLLPVQFSDSLLIILLHPPDHLLNTCCDHDLVHHGQSVHDAVGRVKRFFIELPDNLLELSPLLHHPLHPTLEVQYGNHPPHGQP